MYLEKCCVSCDDDKVPVKEILGFMELLVTPVIGSEGPQTGATAGGALFSGCAVVLSQKCIFTQPVCNMNYISQSAFFL